MIAQLLKNHARKTITLSEEVFFTLKDQMGIGLVKLSDHIMVERTQCWSTPS